MDTPDDLSRSGGPPTARRDRHELAARVDLALADIAALDAMPVPSNPPRHGPRSVGTRPNAAADPYNAIVLSCDVRGTSNGALAGRRIGVKDNLAVGGIPMGGDQLLDVPNEDALVVERLLGAGARITAKTAIGGTALPAGGYTRNPHDPRFSPGFSSSGSGAAVACGLVDGAVGTDLAGSVRIPAAWCGLVGMKATNGLVPSAPGLSMHLIDVIGPIATSVSESAAMLRVMVGDDWAPAGWHVMLDPSSGDLEGLRVGVIAEAVDVRVCTPGIARAFSSAHTHLAELGAQLVPVSVPLWPAAPELLLAMLSLWDVASAGHLVGTDCDYPGRIDEAHPSPTVPTAVRAQRRLVGEKLRPQGGATARLARARNLQLELRRQLDAVLEVADLLIAPTTVQGPFVLDDPRLADPRPEHLLLKRLIRNTAPLSLSGHPALSIPAGRADDDLPAGLQIIGRRFDERSIYRAAVEFEAATPHA